MVAASGRDERTFEAYLEPVEQSLRREGFDAHPGTPERYRADSYHRRQFELRKFGVVDTFVVVGLFEGVDAATAQQFSTAAFQFGLANKSSLPRGVGGNLVVYPIILGETIYEDAVDWVLSYSPNHWAAFEIPLVADPARAEVLYNGSKPMWGRAYYGGFHETIEQSLTPADWTPVTGVPAR
jgi:hypothetical protein